MSNEAVGKSITLKWSGPHRLSTAEDRANFEPPDAPGLYLVVVAPTKGNKISYIGISADSIRRRLKEHVLSTITGEGWLPSDGHLDHGTASSDSWGRESLGKDPLNYLRCDWELELPKALNVIRKLSFFWAPLAEEAKVLKAVESGLICEARALGEAFQNQRVSLAAWKSEKILVSCQLPLGVTIEALPAEFSYGVL